MKEFTMKKRSLVFVGLLILLSAMLFVTCVDPLDDAYATAVRMPAAPAAPVLEMAFPAKVAFYMDNRGLDKSVQEFTYATQSIAPKIKDPTDGGSLSGWRWRIRTQAAVPAVADDPGLPEFWEAIDPLDYWKTVASGNNYDKEKIYDEGLKKVNGKEFYPRIDSAAVSMLGSNDPYDDGWDGNFYYYQVRVNNSNSKVTGTTASTPFTSAATQVLVIPDPKSVDSDVGVPDGYNYKKYDGSSFYTEVLSSPKTPASDHFFEFIDFADGGKPKITGDGADAFLEFKLKDAPRVTTGTLANIGTATRALTLADIIIINDTGEVVKPALSATTTPTWASCITDGNKTYKIPVNVVKSGDVKIQVAAYVKTRDESYYAGLGYAGGYGPDGQPTHVGTGNSGSDSDSVRNYILFNSGYAVNPELITVSVTK
jgi:hypothetical protein